MPVRDFSDEVALCTCTLKYSDTLIIFLEYTLVYSNKILMTDKKEYSILNYVELGLKY